MIVNGMVEFSAGKAVELMSGFEIISRHIFEASITKVQVVMW